MDNDLSLLKDDIESAVAAWMRDAEGDVDGDSIIAALESLADGLDYDEDPDQKLFQDLLHSIIDSEEINFDNIVKYIVVDEA